MKVVKTGATRWVLLIGRWAIKFPRPDRYRNFLQGILGNEQEANWYRQLGRHGKLCPVLFAFPGYFFIVMPKVRVMTDTEAEKEWSWNPQHVTDGRDTPLDDFLRVPGGCFYPVEKKANSFGWLNGKLVIIDYGS